MPGLSTAAQPVGPATNRVLAIDACRGFALLGIFMVNIGFFSRPLGELFTLSLPAGETLPNAIAHYVTHIFFEGKFYAQFSMLFGIGLILQMTRVESAGRKFVPLYLRRLLFLLLLGASHAMFLWYGDILFTYAIAGCGLLIFRKAKPRTLFILACTFIAIATFFTAGYSALAMLNPNQAGRQSTTAAEPSSPPANSPSSDPAATQRPSEPAAPETTPAEPAAAEKPATDPPSPDATKPDDASSAATQPPAPSSSKELAAKRATDPTVPPADRLIAGFESGLVTDPSSPIWLEAEREAYGKGGFGQAATIRIITWLSFLVYEIFGFWWHVFAMFCLGAALHKWGLFDTSRIHWHKRFVLAGLFIGVPLATVGVLIPQMTSSLFVKGAVGGVTQFLAGPLMGLMYIGLMTLAVHHGVAPAVTTAISRVGRMALSNYLMQTVIATYIFYWYGLAKFDAISPAACMGIVVGIYLVQVLFSNLWLSFFRFGPMEWLWRSFTYLKLQPLLR